MRPAPAGIPATPPTIPTARHSLLMGRLAAQGEMLVEIHVNAGSDSGDTPGLIAGIETIVRAALGRFEHRLTRIEVHLTDENGSLKGED